MSQRELDIDFTDSTSTRVESRSAQKARLASVLERGIISDRLLIDLPPDLHGEWVPNVAAEVIRMQALGFKVDTEYAKKRTLHSNGTDQAVIGDVIYMVCSSETKQIIDEIAREKFERIHGNPKNRNNTQAEEREYIESNRRLGIPVLIESKQHAVDGSEIATSAKEAVASPLDKSLSEPE